PAGRAAAGGSAVQGQEGARRGAGVPASRQEPCQLGDGRPRRGRARWNATVNPDPPEDTMPVISRPRRIRPNSAPAYYLGRPASVWISVTTARPGAPQGRRWSPGTPARPAGHART